LTLASPLVLLGGWLIFFHHAQSALLPVAMSASDRFHEEFASGETSRIWTDADEAFRSGQSAETVTKFIARVRRKLGPCHSSEPTGWNWISNANGTFVTVKYTDRCANGSADERLVWRVVDREALLVSIDFASPLLLTD
jgi:hypothetical protein